MNSFFRCVMALTLSTIIAYGIQAKEEDTNNCESTKPLQRKYGSIIAPDLLLTCFLAFYICVTVIPGVYPSFDLWFSFVCGIFISILIYFAVFILFLPTLRKYVSSKTIALIWLLPNYLYITLYRFMALDKPRLVIDVGNISLESISLVWIIGALIVFTVYLIKHFVFRFKLLRNARPVEADSVRELWETMQTEYEFKKACIKIVTSDNTSTPLSIGLFRHTMVLVLPNTEYSEAELKLIFKHELIHIIRSDSKTKMFIAFCNAICWFNPLMWIAMEKCTEDLELSCDEYVVEDCSKEEKDLYGSLILSTAGNEAGFTTCLSASAESLKYRLTNIYKPKRRFTGSIIVGVLVAVMLLTSGNIALSYNHKTVADVFDRNAKEISINVDSVTVDNGITVKAYYCNDPQSFNSYIMSLNVHELTGYYEEIYREGKSLSCTYQTDEGRMVVFLEDNVVKCGIMYEPGLQDIRTYYLDEPVDWKYVMSMVSVKN